MSIGRKITGIERDRVMLRASAMRVIREILSWPQAPATGKNIRKDWLAPPPVTSFIRMEPLGFGLSDEDWWAFDPHDCKPDLVWPLDVGFVSEESDKSPLTCSRFRTVTARDVRGIVSRVGPFMVRMDYAGVYANQLSSAASVQVWLGGKWVTADQRGDWGGNGNPVRLTPTSAELDEGMNVNMATSIALRQRYEWAVALGMDHSPTVRFATDPTGIKEVFRIRDLPEGRDRREQLLTWVTDHWRQDREDPDLEIYVRKHLRGATAFAWQGMRGEILPAQYDLDKREQLLAEREAMRLAGADRRESRK